MVSDVGVRYPSNLPCDMTGILFIQNRSGLVGVVNDLQKSNRSKVYTQWTKKEKPVLIKSCRPGVVNQRSEALDRNPRRSSKGILSVDESFTKITYRCPKLDFNTTTAGSWIGQDLEGDEEGLIPTGGADLGRLMSAGASGHVSALYPAAAGAPGGRTTGERLYNSEMAHLQEKNVHQLVRFGSVSQGVAPTRPQPLPTGILVVGPCRK